MSEFMGLIKGSYEAKVILKSIYNYFKSINKLIF